MRVAGLLMIGSVAAGLLVHNATAASSPPRPPAGTLGALAALPEAPEKAIVINHCGMCHDIDWVVRSGGTLEGWTDRLQRMIRAGAMLPKEQIPAVAAYLAKAFPPRLREGEEK